MKLNHITASPYQAVNILTGVVIIFILAYSVFFGGGHSDYPVECIHLVIYGDECSTCGLSQSFSSMVRGDYTSAMEYNRNGPLLFGFFTGQLFLRSFAGLVIFRSGKRKTRYPVEAMAWTDGLASLVLFIICFRFLLIFW